MAENRAHNRILTSYKIFTGALAALAIVLLSLIMFAPRAAFASDFTQIESGSFILYTNGTPSCTSQAVESGGKVAVITANHCTTGRDDEYSIHLVLRDQSNGQKVSELVYYVEVVKRIPEADISVLRLVDDKAVIPLVDLASAEEAKLALTKGAPVLVVGYPNTDNSPMGELVFTDGRFTGMTKSFVPEVKVPLFRTTVPVHYGNSGGGLYVQIGDTYKLVGITSQTDPSLRWANSLFAPTGEIQKAVRLLAPKPPTDK